MAKTLINILLLFILGMTALPVRQVGKLLHSNQLQEETNDDDAANDATAIIKFMAKEMICSNDGHFISFANPISTIITNFFQFGHGPLLCPPIDIHCPPPNIITA